MNTLKKACEILELHKILLKLSEYTYCEETADMAKQILPSNQMEEVGQELEQTDAAFVLASRFGTPPFARVHSPQLDLKRADAGVSVALAGFLNFAAVLRQARILKDWRNNCDLADCALDACFASLVENRCLEDKIGAVIVSDDRIADHASETLANIRRSIQARSQNIRDSLDKIIHGRSQKYLQESIITLRDGRYVVPVKTEFRSEVPGLVHDTSASGATVFVEPMSVIDANNEIRILVGKEKDEIQRILLELSKECASFSDQILQNYHTILRLDLLFAKANYAIDLKAVKPQLTTNGEIVLRQARHPLLDERQVVPIDVRLGKTFRSLIITGPNTGGKTVSLKTIGLLTLMTMCGFMIPVLEGSRVCVFEHILADIGDEQSIEQSLSTFSAHMTNLVSILDMVNSRSLVLIDELGSGTDPVEGAALAIAIIEQISASGACLAATTHYPELKLYALDTDQVENACCEFDVETLKPTYRLLIGFPGRSNAFAISRQIGLPKPVLARAQALVSDESREFEKVVERLEHSRRQYEGQVKQQSQATKRIRELEREWEEKDRQLREQTDHILETAQEQARYLVDQVRVESNHLLNELERLKKQEKQIDAGTLSSMAKQTVSSGLKQLYQQANPVTESHRQSYELPRPLKAGDWILICDLNKKAQVLQPADKNNRVQVQLGAIKTRLPVSNVRLLQNVSQPKPKSTATRNIKSVQHRSGSTEIDLRGKNTEEALMELDQFIDQCTLSHFDMITIIHGKGTGVLRKAVQQHLKRHPGIDSYRLGNYGEGEAGVTIAHIK